MEYINSTGYVFTKVPNPNDIKREIQSFTKGSDVKGTIIISSEGINVNLSGILVAVSKLESYIKEKLKFCDIDFKRTSSNIPSFRKFVVKIKPEIVTSKINVQIDKANSNSHVSPENFQKELKKKKDLYLLDVRNNYEINLGTFKNANYLNIQSFTEFPEASKTLPKDREIVMFCTGGIRCEKAYKYLKSQNFDAVRQLQGGIINYLNKTNGEHWEGECFVFDDRITLDKNLDPTYQNLCPRCQKIINAFDRSNCQICKEL